VNAAPEAPCDPGTTEDIARHRGPWSASTAARLLTAFSTERPGYLPSKSQPILQGTLRQQAQGYSTTISGMGAL